MHEEILTLDNPVPIVWLLQNCNSLSRIESAHILKVFCVDHPLLWLAQSLLFWILCVVHFLCLEVYRTKHMDFHFAWLLAPTLPSFSCLWLQREVITWCSIFVSCNQSKVEFWTPHWFLQNCRKWESNCYICSYILIFLLCQWQMIKI